MSLRHNAREHISPGAEQATREHHAAQGNVFLRLPATQKGTVVTRSLAERHRASGFPLGGDTPNNEQQSLPLTGEQNPPHHSLSPHQFAAQHDVWWHGQYGDDLSSDSYKEGHEHFGEHMFQQTYDDDMDDDDEPSDEMNGYQGIHFGTRQAAEQRLHTLGPGRAQSEGEAEEMERTGQGERIPGRMFPVTLNKDMMQDKLHRDLGMDWRDAMGHDDEAADEGVFYKNEVEDRESISAAVPTRDSRHGSFFKTWNDHVTEAHDAGAEVHPMLLHAAQRGSEHTGEDFIHPDEAKHASTVGVPEHMPLFQAYGLTRAGAKAKYLDRDYKDTLGPNIKVPSQTIKRRYG